MANIRCSHLSFASIQAIVFDKDGTLAISEAYLLQVGLLRLQCLEQFIPGIGPTVFNLLGFGPAQVEPTGALAIATRQANEQIIATSLQQQGWEIDQALRLVQVAFVQADQMLKSSAWGSKAVHTPLAPGCLQLLQRLKQASLKMAIVSSDTTANIQDFLEHYQLDAFIACGLGADQGRAKPDPDLFYQACQCLGVSPEHTIVIGDAETDFLMARAANSAGVIGASWCWQAPPIFQYADAIAHHPHDIEIIE